jgi:hypothetical protein
MFSRLSNWISSAFINWLTFDRPYEGAPLCDFERICYEVRPCDVLLIEGRSRVSDIIRAITQSSWSHAALYIGRIHDIEDPKIRNLLATHFQGSPDTQLIIEGMMGQGTIISKLTSYQHDHIRLCRPRGLSRRDAQQVIAFAMHKLGTAYDVRQVFDLARFLLPWTIMPRRFRSKLFEHNAGESVKTVCSSMIAEAFASVEFPILPLVKHNADQGIELITRNPKLYSPRDFDYSPYFDIIKYPFVEFADYAMYRKLPWNREGLISHDAIGVRASGPLVSDDLVLNKKKKKKKLSALKRLKDKLGYHSTEKPIDLEDEIEKAETKENEIINKKSKNKKENEDQNNHDHSYDNDSNNDSSVLYDPTQTHNFYSTDNEDSPQPHDDNDNDNHTDKSNAKSPENKTPDHEKPIVY